MAEKSLYSSGTVDLSRQAVVILGVPIDDLSTDQTLQRIDQLVSDGRRAQRTHQVATANVDFIVNALIDPEVRLILQEASLTTADGMPLVWAARLLGVNLAGRVAGADLVPLLVAQAAQKGQSVFFLGGAVGVAARAADILKQRHPELIVAGVLSPPFSSVLEMDPSIVDAVKAAHADILLVAFGNPKQEKWISMHKHELGVPVAMGVGGSLDFIAGSTTRAPGWMQHTGLEWLHRMLHNPRRLVRRYVVDFFIFGSFLFQQWWRMRSQSRPAATQPIGDPLLIQGFGVLSLNSGLTVQNISLFENNVSRLLEQTPHLILDLKNVNFLDSSAIGRLIHFSQCARLKGGELYLAAVPHKIWKNLQFLKLGQYLKFVPSLEEVLQQPFYIKKHSTAPVRFELSESN